MEEAIFGLIGVMVGSVISWFQTYWISKKDEIKNARYLAIRVVCILYKYLEDCSDVVKDDGLCYGQRTADGYLAPQVKAPAPPIYPEDVDWKSIDPELMYKILAFPSEIMSGDKTILAALEIDSPPDFEEWFEERRHQYSRFGLTAHKLAEQLCLKYKIRQKAYKDWDPVTDLSEELFRSEEIKRKKIENHQNFINKVFDSE